MLGEELFWGPGFVSANLSSNGCVLSGRLTRCYSHRDVNGFEIALQTCEDKLVGVELYKRMFKNHLMLLQS